MPSVPVWIDCDPGHDDAIALLVAGHSSRIHLLGVSTVASNQTVAKTTQNAMDVLHWVGLPHVGARTQYTRSQSCRR